MTDTVTILTHDQNIRLAGWDRMTCAKVGSVEGYCADMPHPIEFYITRTIERGQELAWAIYGGSSITASRAFYDEQLAKVAASTTVANGDRVQIEGRLYTLKVLPGQDKAPRYSDPIKFIPIKD